MISSWSAGSAYCSRRRKNHPAPWLARFDQFVHIECRGEPTRLTSVSLFALLPELVGKALANQHLSRTVLADLCIKEST